MGNDYCPTICNGSRNEESCGLPGNSAQIPTARFFDAAIYPAIISYSLSPLAVLDPVGYFAVSSIRISKAPGKGQNLMQEDS